MPDPESTCWTLIRAAAEGDGTARDAFARLYEPIIRAYLGARWRHSPLHREMDDAAQEVFLACFREAGALSRVDADRGSAFRAFLHGVVRNVARRFEDRRGGVELQPDGRLDLAALEAREETLSHVFDRAWATALLSRATEVQAERARDRGEAAIRRVELLRLRFQEGLPIRDIAKRWEEDPARLHREYRKAREDFAEALREVVAEGNGGTPAEIEAECGRLAAYFE